jgi:hypothetical protein
MKILKKLLVKNLISMLSVLKREKETVMKKLKNSRKKLRKIRNIKDRNIEVARNDSSKPLN